MGAVISCNHEGLDDQPLQDAFIALEMRYEESMTVLRSLYHQADLDPEDVELVENLFDSQGQPL